MYKSFEIVSATLEIQFKEVSEVHSVYVPSYLLDLHLESGGGGRNLKYPSIKKIVKYGTYT